MIKSLNFFLVFLILALNFIYYFRLKNFSVFLNINDYPDSKIKKHKKPVFVGGGILLYLNFFVVYFFYIFFYDYYLIPFSTFILSNFIFFIGLFDDKFKLKYNFKFVYLIIILLLILKFDNTILLNNINFSFTNYTLVLGNYTYYFTIICFLLFINSVNLFDGINLQCGSYFFVIFFIFYYLTSNLLFLYFLISLILFLFLNFKNKVFLGDSGTLYVSFLIGYFAINIYNSNYVKADDVFILMLVPGLDMLRLFFVRIYHKQNPFHGDLNHLHHLIYNKFSFTFAFLSILFMIVASIFLKFYFKLNFFLVLIFIVFIYGFLLFVSKKN